jgi:hypothetical protein
MFDNCQTCLVYQIQYAKARRMLREVLAMQMRVLGGEVMQE